MAIENPNFRVTRQKARSYSRCLALEHLEKRHMLATMVDIVFLVDESASVEDPETQNSLVHEWLGAAIDDLDQALQENEALTNPRYGLVGFGDSGFSNAHSHIVDSSVTFTSPEALFGNASQLEAAIPLLDENGGNELGWDAIEHAIAEYNFRDGAVPVFVLVQSEEGRVYHATDWLTRDGVLAGLNSKNVLLNSLVVGPNMNADLFQHTEPMFDLSDYEVETGDFANRRIMGVEADTADGNLDGQHDYYLMNWDTGALVTSKPETVSDTLQLSYNGSNTGATGMVASGRTRISGLSDAPGDRLLALAA